MRSVGVSPMCRVGILPMFFLFLFFLFLFFLFLFFLFLFFLFLFLFLFFLFLFLFLSFPRRRESSFFCFCFFCFCFFCHSREGGNPWKAARLWIPAFAGMTPYKRGCKNRNHGTRLLLARA